MIVYLFGKDIFIKGVNHKKLDIMNETKRTTIPENQFLNIYDASLTFRRTVEDSKSVTIQIRYSKKGEARKQEFPFPENIRDSDLCWELDHKEHITVYHRRDKDKYTDMRHLLITPNLGQKLENLVIEAHNIFMRTDTELTHKKSRKPIRKFPRPIDYKLNQVVNKNLKRK